MVIGRVVYRNRKSPGSCLSQSAVAISRVNPVRVLWRGGYCGYRGLFSGHTVAAVPKAYKTRAKRGLGEATNETSDGSRSQYN